MLINKLSLNYWKMAAFLPFLLLTMLFTGCKKFVDIGPPKNQLVTQSLFTTNASATAAMTVIYSQIVNRDNLTYFLSLYGGLSADELKNYSTVNDLIEFYTNQLNATDNISLQNFWNACYNYIYEANALIEGVNSSNAITSNVKKQLLGEAKFIRAFIDFYLLNCFGDIPLNLTTDYSTNAVASRSSISIVYKQIIQDLLDAKSLLNNKFVDASDTTETLDRVRPTTWAAASLLSRVYLYTKDYEKAEQQATEVISNTSMFDLVPDLNGVFLKNSKEAIWQLMMPQPSTLNTYEGYYFILNDQPSTDISNCTTISDHLLASFHSGDSRRSIWIHDTTILGVTYSYPFKYKVYTSSSVFEYSDVFRLAELYLIRAEARAEQNDLNQAIDDLNAIRGRAGLMPLPYSLSQSQALSAIAHERQVELFTEWGHRWFDIKRTETVNSIMSAITPSKGGNWDINRQLYPIPFTEIANDGNLSQNPGY